jgi:hypothetical protein
MRSVVVIVLFTFLTGVESTCQSVYQPKPFIRKKPNQFGMVAISIGFQLARNADLFKWLESNGVKSSDKTSLILSTLVLFKSRKYLMGFDSRGTFSSNPNLTIFDASFLFGKEFSWEGIGFLPLIGVGGSASVISFGNSKPNGLSAYATSGNYILEKELLINPHFLFYKKLKFYNKNARILLGLELGCKAYLLMDNWIYGDYGHVDAIPNSAVFHPYFSICLGVAGILR